MVAIFLTRHVVDHLKRRVLCRFIITNFIQVMNRPWFVKRLSIFNDEKAF